MTTPQSAPCAKPTNHRQHQALHSHKLLQLLTWQEGSGSSQVLLAPKAAPHHAQGVYTGPAGASGGELGWPSTLQGSPALLISLQGGTGMLLPGDASFHRCVCVCAREKLSQFYCFSNILMQAIWCHIFKKWVPAQATCTLATVSLLV